MMLNPIPFFLTALLPLFPLAFAASPLPPPPPSIPAPDPSSAQVSENLTTAILNNLTFTADDPFPPRSQLPRRGIFFYDIPNSPLNVKFRDWFPYSGPIFECLNVFALATHDSMGHDADPVMPLTTHEWTFQDTVLEVTPEKEEEGDRTLTWAYWLRVIEALRAWQRAYPGLYVGFEVYERGVDGEGRREEWFLAMGVLTYYTTKSTETS